MGETNDALKPWITLLIPFFNEESSVAQLHRRLLPVIQTLAELWKVQLVLVDDGSCDSTFEKLNHFFDPLPHAETLILQHNHNRGIGAAMFTGFSAAKGEMICTLDSDCTCPPEELPAMIDCLTGSQADIVTASPYHPQGKVHNVTRWREFLSKSASRLYALQVPQQLYCYTSFFRVYRREWSRPDKRMFNSDGFLGVTELLIAAAFRRAKIVEYPVELSKRKFGESSMRVVWVSLGHLWLMTKIAWVRFRFWISWLRFRTGIDSLQRDEQFGYGSRYRLWRGHKGRVKRAGSLLTGTPRTPTS